MRSLERLVQRASVASVSLYQLIASGERIVDEGLFMIEKAIEDARRAGLDLEEEARRALIRIRSSLSTLEVNLFPEEVLDPESLYPEYSEREVGQ